jgi:predicted nucleic acid-binding protein
LSGFLLDTNVVSMLAPSRAEASADFLNWLDRMDADGRLFLSVVSIHEIEKGIALLDHKGATAKCIAPGFLDTRLHYAARLRLVLRRAARASSGLR